MNKVWLFLIVSSIGVLLFIDPSRVLSSMLSSSTKALHLSLSLATIYAIWMGIFSILEQTGATKILSKMLSPLINLIFGKNTLSSDSKNLVSMNISANILGMSGAATPLGIKAIESMGKNNTKATFPMIMLTVISCTGFGLLPTSIMGLMAASGSKNPSSIILPSIIAGLISTIVGIVLTKLIHKINTHRGKE